VRGAEVGVLGYHGGDGVESREGGFGEEGEGVVLGDEWGEGAKVGLEEGGVVGCFYGCWVGELGGGEEGSF
jgi:hypothetical protein